MDDVEKVERKDYPVPSCGRHMFGADYDWTRINNGRKTTNRVAPTFDDYDREHDAPRKMKSEAWLCQADGKKEIEPLKG